MAPFKTQELLTFCLKEFGEDSEATEFIRNRIKELGPDFEETEPLHKHHETLTLKHKRRIWAGQEPYSRKIVNECLARETDLPFAHLRSKPIKMLFVGQHFGFTGQRLGYPDTYGGIFEYLTERFGPDSELTKLYNNFAWTIGPWTIADYRDEASLLRELELKRMKETDSLQGYRLDPDLLNKTYGDKLLLTKREPTTLAWTYVMDVTFEAAYTNPYCVKIQEKDIRVPDHLSYITHDGRREEEVPQAGMRILGRKAWLLGGQENISRIPYKKYAWEEYVVIPPENFRQLGMKR